MSQVLFTPPGMVFSGRLDITFQGEGNFFVEAHGEDFPDLLVNEIGDYEGTVRVTNAIALVVTGDGDWTISEAS